MLIQIDNDIPKPIGSIFNRRYACRRDDLVAKVRREIFRKQFLKMSNV